MGAGQPTSSPLESLCVTSHITDAADEPAKADVLKAIALIAPQGASLDLEDIESLQYAQLVGFLDAALEHLVQKQSRMVGRGNTKRQFVVMGHRSYLRSIDPQYRTEFFYQSRLERLAADLKSSLGFPLS